MPNIDKTITIQFRGDSVKFNDEVNNINRMLRSLGNDIKEINKKIKLDPTNAQNYADKMSALTERIQLGEQALQHYREELEPLQQKLRKGETLTDAELKQYANLQQHISETTNRLDSYKKTLAEVQYYSEHLVRLNLGAAFSSLGKSLREHAQAIGEVARSFAGLSAVSSAGLVGASKAAIDFENAMSDVRKVMKEDDLNAGYFESLKNNIIEMSKNMPASANNIAQVVANSLQLGVAAKDADKFAETMIKLGTTTNINADEAAIAIAQFYNIMNKDLDTVDRFGASLVELGNNFPTYERDIMEMAQRLASMGKTSGLSAQEVLGLSTALTSIGLNAESGGSAISTVFGNINKNIASNTKQAQGKVQAFAQLLGLTADEFKKAWGEDQFGTFQNIVKALSEAGAAGENLNAILGELGITNIRQVDSMLRLANANDVFTDALEKANSAWEENSALDAEASQKYQAVAAQLEILKNRVFALSVAFGDLLLPYITKLVGWIGKLVDKFTNLPEGTKKVILAIMGITAAIAPVLFAISKLESGLASLFLGIGKLLSGKGGISQLGQSFNFLKIALSKLSLRKAGVIGLVIGAFVLLYKTSDTFREKINSLVQVVGTWLIEAIKAVWEVLKKVIDTVLPILGTWLQVLLTWLERIWDWLSLALTPVIEVIGRAIQVLIPVLKALWEVIKTVVSVIADVWHWLWEILKPVIDILIDVIGATFTGAFVLLSAALDVVVQLFGGLWSVLEDVWQYLKDIGVIGAFKLAFDGLKGVVGGVVDKVAGLISKLKEALGLGNQLNGTASSKWASGKDSGSQVQPRSSGGVQNNTVNINTAATRITQSDIDRINGSLGKGLL